MPNLVGIGLSQVPTNSMLGGLAYQSPDHASIKDLDLKNLSQINSEIADTANDIFIYDTSKDSDGGAWRKRTTHTSWYNETLNTTTRGSRREFPAVAVIVSQDWGFNIYDGDDPDMPMWASYTYASWDRSVNSIVARDGKICFTIYTNLGYSGNGFGIFDYVRDRQSRNYISGYLSFKNGFVNDLISSKRSDTSYLQVGDNVREFSLVNYNCNDVAMTVLPNAPIDETTGLPVPTIAVGTNDGVSVIKDDGIVISTTSSSGGYHIKKINFTEEYGLNAHIDSSSGSNKALVYVKNFESINGLTYASYANWDGVVYANRYQTNVLTYRTPSSGSAYPVSDFISMSERDGAIGSNFSEGGLTLLEKNNEDAGQGIVAFATTSYNTGWMHGDIKGAFLSDTDATNVTGSELVSNGTFDSDATGWTTNSNGTLVSSGGRGVLTNTQTGDRVRSDTSFTTVVGKTYVLTFNTQGSGGFLHLGTSAGGVQYAANLGLNGNGDYSYTFVATSTTTWIQIGLTSTANGATSSYDNISVRIANPDRSVNNNGLQVFGTITKSAVATGAELVAYSGFHGTNSNYLKQPYNSDLDFGTGDFSVMFWAYNASWPANAEPIPIYRGDNWYSTGNNIFTQISSGRPNVFLGRSGNTETITATSTIANGVWSHVVLVRSGSTVSWYINGKFDTSGTSSRNLTNTNAELLVGVWNNNNNTSGGAVNSKYALIRLSASAPSPEQIKKIYEDEKVLFQDNAACTLYGSSDAVTALAYDDSTNILYAGTSSGRSDFQGLRRINNTTTAVTTAMSASNGLVAEQ